MNMNPENQDFESLRRLVRLKRHEQPPPRYLNDFSSQVIQRIKAEVLTSRPERIKPLATEAPWMQRLLRLFEGKPMLAGGLGAAVCALLLMGLAYSERMEAPPSRPELGGGMMQASGQIPTPAFGTHAALAVSSTNPVTGPSIFDQLPMPNPRYTSLRPSGQ
jgi:hypothetical protein